MSRSYHTTRRHLEEAQRRDESDAKRRAAGIEKLRQELEVKRRAKRLVKRERHDKDIPASTPIETIPISVKETSRFSQFPASPSDLRAILAALPPGTADGLKGIELSLGTRWSRKADGQSDDATEVDPYVGRPSYTALPGVYCPWVLGRYLPRRYKIELYAYVYDAMVPDLKMWELYLRLHMLMTFLHEVAHHWDMTHRVARGRWRADNDDKVEIWAEKVEHEWIATYVIPYLKRAYPEDLARLRNWMQENLGVQIPIPLLAGDPRARAKDGAIFANATFFNTSKAFERFVSSILSCEPLDEARVQFARDMHYTGTFDLANAVIDVVVAADSRHLEALTLRADILEHQSKYHEALAVAMNVLAVNPEYDDAMFVVADAHEGLKQWASVRQIADALIRKHPDGYERGRALAERALACIELRDYLAATADIDELARNRPLWKRRAERLRQRMQECMNGKVKPEGGGDSSAKGTTNNA